MKIKANLIDFLTSGNIIGEMGLLTKKPRSATVSCETAVQVITKKGNYFFAIIEFKYNICFTTQLRTRTIHL